MKISPDAVCGILASNSAFSVEHSQLQAWREQVNLLQPVLEPYVGRGHVFFEFVLPRIGRRVDVVLVLEQLIFVLEFKVGESEFQRHALDQVWDYALDLKNFHESSHRELIIPVLIATRAAINELRYVPPAGDEVYTPLRIGALQLGPLLKLHLDCTSGPPIDGAAWGAGRYSPTPTIIEAARALYSGHSVVDISRSDAGASNLTLTSSYVSAVIADAQQHGRKAVCFLTGVPGAGKTLVGLDIATQHMDAASALHSIFL
ncbi:MAG: DNA/RNA helicase domain-containing protein, partial [Hydrogenophaga sp.]|nr:DNA/RNA helicase domain-containing protein [Hydrogenophaga sp.]